MTRRDLLKLGGLAALMPVAPGGAQQRPLPKSEFDYVDWSWERWRDLTKSERPRVKTAQTGVAELLDLRNPSAASAPPAWTDRRRVIGSTLREFLGDAPANGAAMEAEVLDETAEQTHVRRRVRFRAATGEWIPGYLLVPRRSMTAGTRGAAVLCPHQTTQEASREPAGLAGNPEQATARHLVDRGFVTLTWDALCFGARHDRASGHYGDAISLYRTHPRWSLLGKMIADLSRAVDYLTTLDFVDPARIGCVGHSHGGITTIFGMALEPRLAAGASNCGFDTFRIDGNVWRWSHATALVPRLGFYMGSPYLNMDRYRAVPDSEVIQVPFDLHEVLALAAPRPLFLSTSDADFVFPNAGWSARMALARLRPVYSALGAADRLQSAFSADGHSLPATVSKQLYDWLERELGAKGA
ncbi:MAG TPA: prolyl oligopeptidase family serine peptidase [Vicinamibacterales bacterium]|jgi:dienelactone hydrolase|nr:prolyl oligopeptidase family serine peptidase [Vicinamibacterales bacterium]